MQTTAPTSTAAVVPLESAPVTYTVQSGDTLFAIALDFGTSVEELVNLNELEDDDSIDIGQVLRLPSNGPSTQPVVTQVPLTTTTPITVTAPRLPAIQTTFITQGPSEKPQIALTFDACETEDNPAGYDEEIIDVLTETATPATLFLGGHWMQSHPTQTLALAANPLFELGNHSWSHLDFASISREEIDKEILWTQDMMYSLIGRQPRVFRLPFGTFTDEALDIVASHGLYTIQWDIVTGDPDPNVTGDAIYNAVVAQAHNGAIVIMHMNGRGWHTAEALPAMIGTLREQGYTFVTISEMLELEDHPVIED
jgi:peptidoglycan/xylan/chitin deacetylase (PgdA/CDA1 family)